MNVESLKMKVLDIGETLINLQEDIADGTETNTGTELVYKVCQEREINYRFQLLMDILDEHRYKIR
ncbi:MULTISPECIES: hypothetical protein [Clostridium]|uniref:hypothetical protein n=1 Tax=Clostridium TaxID=1485 RepID=UPI000825F6BF|nr:MULTISPECIES: hypothetical protein [Clostridium]PJI08313.1 hypothetical protein CUB90_10750 [Clostridium sp. CT7]